MRQPLFDCKIVTPTPKTENDQFKLTKTDRRLLSQQQLMNNSTMILASEKESK